MSAILFAGSYFLLGEPPIGFVICCALLSVIIIASLIGTFVPLLLDKFG
jgi:magnesium transporter